MTLEDQIRTEKAFAMLLGAVTPFQGMLTLERVKVASGGNKYENKLIVQVSTLETDTVMTTNVAAQLELQLQRECYEIFKHRGLLLTPRVEFVAPKMDA